MPSGDVKRGRMLAALTAAAALVLASAVGSGPVTPCSSGSDLSPAYGESGAAPRLGTWHGIALDPKETCSDTVRGPMQLVIALAGRFEGAQSLEALAARLGAVSSTKGLLYWSTTDGAWRELISDAFALETPAADTPRPDFGAEEVLSGRTLYFAQKDTRSTSLNVYSLRARTFGPNRLIVEIVNLTPIRFLLVTLFEPRSLLSVHFIERSPSGVWSYYGLSTIRAGSVDGHEASFINRAAAFYRFVREVPGDAAPPLAP